MTQYRIPPHVHLCLTDGVCVWLDVKQNKYFGTEATNSGPLATLIEGWPVTGEAAGGCTAESNAAAEVVARNLFESGLLTRDCEQGRPATPVYVEKPCQPLIADDARVRGRIRWQYVCLFVFAIVMTFLALKVVSFDYALRAIESQKQRASHRAITSDLTYIRELVTAFLRLRLFAFTSKDYCLFDSLALMRFLISFDVYPALIIGVSAARPFRAHCWVQQAGQVFNCDAELARGFTPIRVI